MKKLTTFATCLAVLGCDATEESPIPFEPRWEIASSDAVWWMNTLTVAPDDRWVVGGTPEAGAVKHFDGQTWTDLSLAENVPLLNWMHPLDDGTLMMVGNAGTILHWRTPTAAQFDLSTEEDLWGIWGASDDDIWAVGGSAQQGATATILHYDGEGWSNVPVPVLERPAVRAFFKIWGSGPGDAWIVGQNGVLLHWDGAAWTESGVGTSQDLIAVWGTSSDRVAMVGGRGNGVAYVYDGATWTPVGLDEFQPGLNGVWMGEGTPIYAVGANGTAVAFDESGTVLWSHFANDDLDPLIDLHALHGTPDGSALTAVGGTLNLPKGPFEGAVLTATP